MKNFVKKNINNDLIFTGLNYLWRLVSGPITLVLIPLYLSAEEQGYWYTFSSLAALSILADLGFSTIVLQFSAHEFAYLRFENKYKISGDKVHLEKLASLFIFCLKWSSSITAIAFPIILIVGYYILSSKSSNVPWFYPWIIYGVSSAIVFLNSTILCFFEGCNLVSRVQSIRFKMAVCVSITMFICLILKFNLYALSFSLCTSAIIGIFLIYSNFWIIIKNFVRIAENHIYSWKKEFLSLLWRYAISWSSGYFIFQIYTPLVFHFYDAAEAGKVGISIALWMAVFGISNIWMSAITPKLNMYVSKKEWKLLDSLFNKNLLLSGITFLVGLSIIFLIIYLFKGKLSIIERFVDVTSMFILGMSWFMQNIINSLAVYLRAHKEEPFVLSSLFLAIYISITTLLCVKYLSLGFLFLGYLTSNILILPWVVNLLRNRRKKHLYE